MSQHVAIMRRSWRLIEKILTREKTIESRWSNRRIAPWDRLELGDPVYFKDSGGPVRARAVVEGFTQLADLTPSTVRWILEEYGAAIGISADDLETFYERFKDKRYCTLIFLGEAEGVTPFEIDRAGYSSGSAWLVMESVEQIRLQPTS